MAIATGPTIKAILVDTYEAGADLSSNQFYGVELTSTRTITVVNAITDRPIGILQNKPTSGQFGEVIIMGKVKILATETIAVGDQIRIHSDGKAAIFAPDTDTTAYCIGQCTLGGGSGEYIEAVISCTALDRGEE